VGKQLSIGSAYRRPTSGLTKCAGQSARGVEDGKAQSARFMFRWIHNRIRSLLNYRAIGRDRAVDTFRQTGLREVAFFVLYQGTTLVGP
jgi:hypothetical protein